MLENIGIENKSKEWKQVRNKYEKLHLMIETDALQERRDRLAEHGVK